MENQQTQAPIDEQSLDSSIPVLQNSNSNLNSNVLQPSSKNEFTSVLKWLGIFVVVVIILLTGIIYFFPHIIPVILLIKPVSKIDFTPFSAIPVKKELISQQNQIVQKSPEYTSYGLSFKTSWKLMNKIDSKGIQGYKFEGNHDVIVFDGKLEPKIISEWKKNKTEDFKKLEEFFGQENLKSEYSLYSLMLNSRIENVTLFSPPNEAIANSILIVMKSVMIFPDSQIYEFTTNNLKGFQFHASRNRYYEIILFDQNDNIYKMIIRGNNLYDSDIDTILLSLYTQN